jgi:putative membrane protein
MAEPPLDPPLVGPERDRGLQVERTSLAWRRTLLSFTAACAVAWQTLPGVDGSTSFALAAAVALALTPPLWWFAKRHARHTALHLEADEPRLRHGRRIVLMCAGTALLGLAGLVAVLVF